MSFQGVRKCVSLEVGIAAVNFIAINFIAIDFIAIGSNAPSASSPSDLHSRPQHHPDHGLVRIGFVRLSLVITVLRHHPRAPHRGLRT